MDTALRGGVHVRLVNDRTPGETQRHPSSRAHAKAGKLDRRTMLTLHCRVQGWQARLSGPGTSPPHAHAAG